jgi:hypothetical protein
MTTADILAAVARWPLAWREAHAERVAIKVCSGISEGQAILQAWQEYRERAEAEREP